MPDPEPKRRWFQFSLRVLLLVVVAGNVFWWTLQYVQAAHSETDMWRKRAQDAEQRAAIVHTMVHEKAEEFFDKALQGYRTYRYKRGVEYDELKTQTKSDFQIAQSFYEFELRLDPESTELESRVTDVKMLWVSMYNVKWFAPTGTGVPNPGNQQKRKSSTLNPALKNADTRRNDGE